MNHLLRADNISKSYGGRRVVDGVSLNLQSGEIVGLLGPNGAGKTTSFYICLGLAKPDGGRVSFDEREITNLPMYQRARLGIGYLPQEPSIFRKLTVYDNVYSILETRKKFNKQELHAYTLELLDQLGVGGKLVDSPASALSGGERRRVEIARCLALDPAFILLDEPFAGIDPLAIADIQQIVADLARRGIGVLITDHNVRETLAICSRAYILVDGRVLEEGTPDVIANSEKARRYYLGDDFAL
ncbi:MAG TPA: LPS export ABC transporter ATP-binding protein [Oligoflexia bacterium]|nr:LPS export ABC transporter ATP-binding protein [Oligoflexia bacterium]HMP26379.1 LPS export ABC transporter ATP-binding protein [Oligoflexia bacterium]